ncbi:MAG: AmmeMemoRadiSam system protein A [Saccharofermentanales bacterium]
MGKIINAYIMPHAPILIPAIGGERGREAQKSMDGCRTVARLAVEDEPDTIIISSPHAPSFKDFAVISRTDVLTGNFAQFGHPEISLKFTGNTALAESIIRLAGEEDIPVGSLDFAERIRYGLDAGLDHGAMVPLWFLNEAFSDKSQPFRLVHLSTPFFDSQRLYDLGRLIDLAVIESDSNVVYIASGDLSHRLTHDAPAGYSPAGRVYDEKLVDLIKKADIESILSISPKEMHDAGECGTKSFIIALGALDGTDIRPAVYSYEGPFGVGYLCAVLDADAGKNLKKSKYVQIAQRTIEEYVTSFREISVADLADEGIVQTDEEGILCDPDLDLHAGVFVSLKKQGELRGCIGTIFPTCSNVIEEIVQNAISASMKDPRFESVRPEELAQLVYSVDVLGEPENVGSLKDLDAKRYGVIVTKGFRRGLLLPDLEGVDTPEEQISIALRKAGISAGDHYTIQRCEVVRYH